jgi:hypothetical protein
VDEAVRKTLRWNSVEYEILDERDSIMKFRDVNEALLFLRKFRNDPAQMAQLRSLLAGISSHLQPANDDDLLRRVALLLAAGRITLLAASRRGASTAGEEAVKRELAKETEKKSSVGAAPKRHWVEFRVVDDKTGNPVKGIELTVKLPDGSIEKRKTDQDGYIEINDTLKGACEVSCETGDEPPSNMYEFVRMG